MFFASFRFVQFSGFFEPHPQSLRQFSYICMLGIIVASDVIHCATSCSSAGYFSVAVRQIWLCLFLNTFEVKCKHFNMSVYGYNAASSNFHSYMKHHHLDIVIQMRALLPSATQKSITCVRESICKMEG